MPQLIVNIDHIATIRQARLASEPDPIHAAFLAELGGAQGIIVHLREDRRHIQDRDLQLLRQTISSTLHLEMAATEEMHSIALDTKPEMVCLVPEKREELTTEGGLNLIGREQELKDFCASLHDKGITSSLFIDADPAQIESAKKIGTQYIELHTGHYADATDNVSRKHEVEKILNGIRQAQQLELKVNLGHGLNYTNIMLFSQVHGIAEYSIGHSIVARASLIGLEKAVRDMNQLISTFAS
jgi:pyridoxine 5-phosphate synthase